MANTSVYWGLVSCILRSGVLMPLMAFLDCTSANAQVIPDSTLNTTVSQSNDNFTITNGNRIGNNLFHSFSQFSVPTNSSAFFDNALDIQNIFSRVTGANVSNIDGLIKANGSANLFLLNPSGIIFGANAQLNIGGSFIGTTAESIKFADGFNFKATDTTTPPLLTMSVPVGLQFGSNPGAITVKGSGHNAQLSDSARVSGLNVSVRGLQVKSEKSLALVGGNLAIDGGLLSAPGGHIELGSVIGGSVDINSIPQGFGLSYPNPSTFGNIQMTQRALGTVRGTSSGSIQIQGKQVRIGDGSILLVQNQGNQTAGDITINATESLQIVGKSPDFSSSSSLINETLSSGAAGNIIINTLLLNVEQGGYIFNRTFGEAPGGNIVINTYETGVNAFAAGDPSAFRSVSQIVAASYGNGKGGNIVISTKNLLISAGGNVAARPYASGSGGDVTVKADTIQVTSAGVPTGNYFSLLSTATFGSGNAGDLLIDTRKLSVQTGSRVSASSIVLGNAGSLTVNASESIDVSGIKDALNPSYIGTAVRPVGSYAQLSRGNSGNTTINTPVLNISDGATVFVENLGFGTAGTLQINANTLKLDNNASISASTTAGEGGNIDLRLRNILLMRHDSFISAEAGGSGNGGNITIDSPIITGLENSDIIANAVKGRGGNIQIETQGMIGLKYSNLLNPKEVPTNDITASSQFNLSGTVQINNIGVDPNSGLVELPENVTDPSQQIASGCSANQGSRFVATGRGGIPQNPNQHVANNRTWSDIRDISTYRNSTAVTAQIPSLGTLVQATGWHRNAQGKIELIANKSSTSMQQALTCAGVIKS